MKRKFNPFAKAIETKYDGYNFRSRLEARWATFFNALSIPYAYEHEGFDLEGTWYLPDFWLPEQKWWLEIKGEEPTEEEINKTKLLALYTQKNACILYGNIEPPSKTKSDVKSIYCKPPEIWTYHSSDGSVGGPSTTRIEAPLHILAILQKLHDSHIDVFIDKEDGISLEPRAISYDLDDIDGLLLHTQKQTETLKAIQSIVEERKEEILDILIQDDGWELEFVLQPNYFDDYFDTWCLWGECDVCGRIRLICPGMSHDDGNCKNKEMGIFISMTPRVLAAYKTAREARF